MDQPRVIALEETQTSLPFTSTEAKIGFMVIKEQRIDFAMAESLLLFLQDQQSCELIATGLSF